MRTLLLAALVALAAAGSTEAQDDQTLTSPFGFDLRLPADWRRTLSGEMVLYHAPWETGSQPTLAVLVLPEGGGGLEGSVEQMARNLDASDETEFFARDSLDMADRKAQTLHYRIETTRRTVWQLAVPLGADGEAALVLTFGAASESFDEHKPAFVEVCRSFRVTTPREADPGYRLFGHPIGLAFEIPEDWTAERIGNRVFFAPTGFRGERYPLVLAVTAPAPIGVRDLDSIEQAIKDSLDQAGIAPDLISDTYLGDFEARVVTWTVRDRREVVRQTALVWEGTLVTLTVTGELGKLHLLEPVFEHAEDTWSFGE